MQKVSLKKNFVMNVILQLSSMIFPLISYPYVSRVLGPSGIGTVSFAYSVVSYFSMLAQLGIPTYGIRACAQVRDDREKLTRTAQELLLINLLMNVVAYAGLFLCVMLIPRLRSEAVLYVIMSALILLTSLGMEWLYQALEQYTYITVRSCVFKMIGLVAMFVLVRSPGDVLMYGFLYIFATCACNVFNFFYARHFITLRPAHGWHLRQHLKPVGIFFAMTCATTIYTQMDRTMLGFMTDDAEVGLYNTASNIKLVLASAVTSLGTVLLPRVSYYVAHREEEGFRQVTEKALNVVLDMAFPILVFFLLFADDTVYLLSGSAYEGSIRPLQIVLPTVLFIGLSNLFGMEMLVPMGGEKHVLYSEILGALVNLVLNALLIPKYQSSGAAVGTLVAEAVVLLYQAMVLRSQVGSMLLHMSWWKMILSSVLAGAAVLPVRAQGWNSALSLIAGFLLYGIVFAALMLLSRESLAVQLWTQLRERRKGADHG